MKFSRVGTIISAGFALAVVVSGPAFAHAALTATSPANGSESTDLTEVSLTATEDLLDLGDDKGFDFAVTDSDGHFYGDGCVSINGATASMPVQLGAAGDYTVSYRGVSADGHAIDGAWTFTYSPAPDAVVGEPYLELPVCGAITAQDDGLAIAPLIGIATIPVIALAIWLLMRSLGKRDSEDHLS